MTSIMYHIMIFTLLMIGGVGLLLMTDNTMEDVTKRKVLVVTILSIVVFLFLLFFSPLFLNKE